MANNERNQSYLSTMEPRQIYERLKLVWGLYKDKRVSRWHKMVLLLGIAYAAMPIDLIPDFIPGLGIVDDLIVLLLVADWFIQICPPAIVEEHHEMIYGGISDFDEDLKTLVYIIKKEFHVLVSRKK